MSSKEKKKLSIPPYPDTIFVVELDKHILITGFPITECIFPIYRFDKNLPEAFEAAENIAMENKKLVVNAIDFHLHDPLIYDPFKIQEQMENLIASVDKARAQINFNGANKNPLT